MRQLRRQKAVLVVALGLLLAAKTLAVGPSAVASRAGSGTGLGSALPSRIPLSHGKVVYVDGTKGRDGTRGTKQHPWRTIQNALNRVSLNGGTIVVRGGTYAGENAWYRREGNPANPVTLRSYPGERVTLTGVEGDELPAIWIYGGGGLRVRGFDIVARWSDGIRVEDAHDVEIIGCSVHNAGHQGILVVGTGSTPPTGNRNIQLWANRFHDNGGAYISEDPYWIKGDQGVYWGAVSDNVDGIDHSVVGGVIANNLFFNQPYGRLLQIGSQVDGTIVTNNTFYRAFQPNHDAGDGVVFYAEDNRFATRNVLLVNNIIADNAHNGIDGSGQNPLMHSNVVRGNLLWNNPDGDINRLDDGVPLFTLGPGNVTGKNPLFVDPTKLDFGLQSRSPARGRSIPEYTPKIDRTGRLRDASPDLGALEFVRR